MDFKLFVILTTVVATQFAFGKDNDTLLTIQDIISDGSSTTQKLLDSISKKGSKHVKRGPRDLQVDEKINLLANQLVQAIVTKLDIESKITDLVLETLATMNRKKVGVQAIKTRRILEYISKKMSAQIMKNSKKETRNSNISPFVYGLAQTTAEISIVAALKDITFATPLIAEEPVEPARTKRSLGDVYLRSDIYTKNFIPNPNSLTDSYESQELKGSTAYIKNSGENLEVIPLLKKGLKRKSRSLIDMHELQEQVGNLHQGFKLEGLPLIKNRMKRNPTTEVEKPKPNKLNIKSDGHAGDAFDLLPKQKTSIQVTKNLGHRQSKGFFNQTRMEFMKNNFKANGSHGILLHGEVSESVVVNPSDDYDVYNKSARQDEADLAEIEQYLEKAEDKSKSTPKIEELDTQANKAIDFCGEVAVYAGESTIALRRALTAALEVKMSVNNARDASSNNRNIAMNLAKTAARQSGKEAKIANVKSADSEKALREATKLTALSIGSTSNHLATRILIESIALSTIAKSMAYVSSEVAIDSLYQVADVKRNM